MYNPILKKIHQIFIFLQIDSIIVNHFATSFFGKWIIPSHTLYAAKTIKKIKRDKTFFSVDVSDYMQWHIFASIPEIAWVKAVESLSMSNGGIVMDIGSNVGAFALKVASNIELNTNDSKVIAFDPNPYIQNYFQQNLELNPSVKNKVEFHLNAVGSESKVVDFSFDNDNSGTGKISSNGINNFPTTMITLDNFVVEYGLTNIKFIKIDVEGFEPYVFEGAKEILTKYHPDLYFEITEKWHINYGKSSKYIFDLLKSLNYTLYLDEDNHFKKVEDGYTIVNNKNQYNFYATCN
jgi:FkbM family methyltransferase